ncbi:hypothetical protein QJS10_CPA10g01189 [Acorus calamus]|uniref:Transposase n=1 Tax=Acorus calamus TaxID=4465 RepID=A0AAV9E136_ACOCL|nr:hypothetical protein QJS10_CPA10g01189 [Acorus calamus]
MMRKRGRGISMSERLHSTSEPQSRPHSQPSLHLPPHRQSRSERLPQSHRQSSQAASQATVSTPLSNDSGASMCGTSNSKKGRGSARSLSIWGTGEKLHVNFNEMQPIGLNATKLTSQLGYIARDSHRVPLTYVSWSDMPEDILDDIWRDVEDNTNAPAEYKDNCLRSVGKYWKDWKGRLKSKYFNTYKTNEERIKNVPPRVESNQWNTLVQYWGSEEAAVLVDKNKRNREQQGLLHRTGRTSFAELRRELASKGEATDRMSVFVKSRQDKSGRAPDEETAEVIVSVPSQQERLL